MDFTRYFNNNRLLKAYGGANGGKVAVDINGSIYMLKFPPTSKDKKELSYSNSCISEYISCQIISSLEIDVQETTLGTVYKNTKEYICVACKDFEVDDWDLYEFALVKNTCIETSQNGYGIELSEVLGAIEEQLFIPVQEVRKFFWQMFVVDAFLGNFDRHNGNWGFLVNSRTNETKIAPIFDCGSCLYPQLSDVGIKKVLSDKDEIDKRIYVFPNSAIKIDGKKINYFDFLINSIDSTLLESIIDIYNRIDVNRIFKIIETTPFISEIRKDFYKVMIKERYDKIIVPAANRAKNFLSVSTELRKLDFK